MDAISGVQYDETFGQLVDYAKQAEFLRQQLSPDEVFIDLACGTGRLLAELEERVEWELWGVDIDECQLNMARKRTKSTRFVSGDVFAPDELDVENQWQNGRVHLGFAFVNRLSRSSRASLLKAWVKHSQVQSLILEAWNLDHQRTTFVEGELYKRAVKDGQLRSRYELLDESQGKIQLEMEFEVESGTHRTESIMFWFDSRELVKIAEREGWRGRIAPAIYRDEGGASHDVIILSRN